jgi:hypothetical protein
MQYKRVIGEMCGPLHKRYLACLVQETASSVHKDAAMRQGLL